MKMKCDTSEYLIMFYLNSNKLNGTIFPDAEKIKKKKKLDSQPFAHSLQMQ